MIDTILDYTRIEFGKIKVNPEKFSLNALLNEMVAAIKVEAEKKQIALTCSLPETGIELEADRSMIDRVINNLVGNSIKYTPDGGKVNVNLELGEGRVRITVSDSGIGIDPQHLNQIFDKFFMVSSTGAREKRSLGLGLSIAKNFVQAHQGKIWAESEGLGKGSRFIVELPLSYQA
jgi:signal transduction histidine kinase